MTATTGTKHDPFSLLLNIEERVRLCGAALPSVVDRREKWTGVRCTIAGINCILPLDDIAEVLENRQPTIIPGCAAWIRGVLNLRGRLLPVFGIDDFLEGKGGRRGTEQVVVVDKGAVFCGLAVEKIHGMKKFYADGFQEFQAEEDGLNSDISQYVESVTVFNGSKWYQLNIEALARTLMQTNPAAFGSRTTTY